MSRIKGSDSDLGSLFNIEIDPRRPSALTRMAAKVSKWSPRTTLAVLGGSVTGAIVLGFLAGRKSVSTPPAVSVSVTPGTLPAVASSTSTPAVSGGHLTVTTPLPRKLPGQLRAGASETANRLSTVPFGTIVQVLNSTDAAGKRWYQVQTPTGQTGWMHGDILS